jgi:hypothetical protein
VPKFTILLQTSPGRTSEELVNSLPPIKSPEVPLASGDTVPKSWVVEVATMADVTTAINKQVETLTARIAALEAKVRDLSTKRDSVLEANPGNDSAAKSGKEQVVPENKPTENSQGKKP